MGFSRHRIPPPTYSPPVLWYYWLASGPQRQSKGSRHAKDGICFPYWHRNLINFKRLALGEEGKGFYRQPRVLLERWPITDTGSSGGVAVDDDDDDGQLNMVSVIEILLTWTNKKCQSQLGIDCCSKEELWDSNWFLKMQQLGNICLISIPKQLFSSMAV